MNIRKNEGITMIALVVTVVILLILSTISINEGLKSHEETQEETMEVELTIVQHAIMERYTKSQLTKETLPGTALTQQEVEDLQETLDDISDNTIQLKGTEYKKLETEDLRKLGIKKSKDTYIVNYKTGEVLNNTTKTTRSGNVLYTYSKSE